MKDDRVKLTIRWPKEVWDKVNAMAMKNNVSMQTLVSKIVLDRLGIDNWIVGTQSEVEKILTRYDYVPEDVQEEIDKAMIKLGRV